MPGPWLNASADPEAWASASLQAGDYIEYWAYDTSHTRQGTVVARVDNVTEKTAKGQWTEIAILAASDDHLLWWLDHGAGRDENWEYELHVCKAQSRQCRQSKRGRGHDFHTDKYRVLTLGDLADRRPDWIRKSKCKKYIDEEVARMQAPPPLGKDPAKAGGAAGLTFEEGKLPAPDPSHDDEALKGLGELEKELGETPRRRKKRAQNDPHGGEHGPLKREGRDEHLKKKKKRKKDPGHGRAQSAPAKAENKKDEPPRWVKDRLLLADRGPFGSGHRVDYGKSLEISSGSSDEAQLFRDGPSSGNGTSLQLQLQEYALKRPGRLAARLLQRMQSLVGKEGGPISNMTYANKTPPVAMNFVLTVLAPRQMPVRTLREMKTLAAALDQIAAGRSHSAADLLAQRLKALELSQTDSTWNRAQFIELVEPEGPALLEREEAVLASKEWASELRMKKLQGGKGPAKGDGKADKGNPKGEEKGGKAGKKNRPGRVKDEVVVKEEDPDYGGGSDDDATGHPAGTSLGEPSQGSGVERTGQGRGHPIMEPADYKDMVADGTLAFDWGELGESDDEGLPMGKADSSYSSSLLDGLSMNDWRKKMRSVLDREPGMKPLGKVLMEAMLSLKSGLGAFAREYSNPEKLPRAASPDQAPQAGVTEDNVHWVRAIMTALNYLYCAGWAAPVCVPMSKSLSLCQLRAVGRIAGQAERFAKLTPKIGPAKAAIAKLSAKKFDYSGQAVEHMLELDAEKVIKAWPKPGSAAVVDLQDCLPDDLKKALDHPRDYLLPETELPERHRGSKVRATDEEWYKIVKAGYDRGMFVPVSDDEVPVDRRGHLITNGAGAVAKTKVVAGRTEVAQRFISVLCPMNDAMVPSRDSYLVIDSEDLQSAFNLFRLPLAWAPFFGFAKKVRGDALGLSRHETVRPPLRVVPMGWTSAVTLIQAAIRHISYEIARIPPYGDVRKDQPLPAGDTHTVLYLDNFDEVRYLKEETAEKEAGQPSENHRRFITACELLGLPRNLGKQLCGALSGTLQGGELLGREKILRHSYDKSVELFELSMALLTQELMSDYSLRHWTGKAAFAAAFRRPIYSVLQEVYGVMDWAASGAQVSLPIAAIDEVLVFMAMLPLAETDLSSEISPTISCTDASPTGGGSSVATVFKDKSLLTPLPVTSDGHCGCCKKELVAPSALGTMETRAAGAGGMSPGLEKGLDVAGDPWDFKTDAAKERLDSYEADGNLVWTHWSPDRRTFSRFRGEWERDHQGKPIQWQNVPFVACWKQPGKISLRRRMVLDLLSDVLPRRGNREWTTIVHNSPSLHAVLEKKECERNHTRKGQPDDPENNDPYPWDFCLVFMEGVYDELVALYSEPFGARDLTLGTLMEHQLRGATKGLQDAAAVAWAAEQTVQFLETMDTHQELEHLKWLLRHAHHTGCDVRLTNRGDDVFGHRPGPYPAFRWLWKDVLSYRWKEEQHINILELTAFLTELRRRARDPAEHGRSYFNVVDSLVCFYVLGKGRSSSKNDPNDHVDNLEMELLRWLPRTYAELDEEVAEYINHLYQEGDSVSFAGWVLSGLKRFHPRCRGQLATSQLYLRNWQRVHLPKRTTPLSWLGAKAMASAAAQIGRFDLALMVLLGFAFFLRTMELLSLAATHVRLFPDQGTVIIAIVNSKTSKGLQQSLSLREPELVQVLVFLWDRASPGGLLYAKTPLVFRREFAALVRAVGLDPVEYLPYCMRRGGATFFYQRSQSLGQTMIQGRWKDQTTARVYVDDARATLVQLLLPSHVTAHQQKLASFWRVASPGG
ncbi:unnamed protein product [Symbiodinium sp. CCMP2592]|nr:unnamed protein product [Symbiodinium sp. CCMP2592]